MNRFKSPIKLGVIEGYNRQLNCYLWLRYGKEMPWNTSTGLSSSRKMDIIILALKNGNKGNGWQNGEIKSY